MSDTTRPELKSIDVVNFSFPPGPIDPDPITWISAALEAPVDARIIPLNCLIKEGTEAWQRLGRKARMKFVKVKMTPCGEDFDGVEVVWKNQILRFLLVLDRQPNGVVPEYIDIFRGVTATGEQTWNHPWTLMLNQQQKDRFEFLWDRTICITKGNNTVVGLPLTGSRDLWHINETIKLDFETLYGGNSGGIGDLLTNALYLVAVGNDIEPLSTELFGILMQTMVRLFFEDVDC